MQAPSATGPAHTELPGAALGILAILETVMLAALMTRTPPHPPIDVIPFAMAPFLGVSIAMAVAALMLGGVNSTHGRIASISAGALALLSFGPQKWIDPMIGRIWPAVLLGQLAVAVIVVAAVASQRAVTKSRNQP